MENEPQQEVAQAAVISRNSRIEGDWKGDEDLIVEGYFKGAIQTRGNLHVKQTGNVDADVHANNVIIEGRISGNVYAQGHLEIHTTGQMIGDIAARAIDIKEGSSFEGRSRMIKSNQIRPA